MSRDALPSTKTFVPLLSLSLSHTHSLSLSLCLSLLVIFQQNKTGALVGDDVAAQAEKALTNMKSVIEAAGGSMERVLKTTVLLRTMDDFAALNAVYAKC